ncbi:DUF4102 domain-containing protein [Rhizobium leguminosarum bv. viciae]|uniref:Tyrosine-type recombinase/integrase n=2 Tax=Rhizobium/Agrobacterium group TaxID=227290 RepID=A0A6P0DKK0_RHILE|nr:site-specific integrase [Rhizobium leguminosarum]NKJ81533.1 tyrosine-type recombinase/integrase [Rhizobium leguminosarum bv. viciae]TBB68241.1 DUF4102 domain-containing protein [Rhizobium ruizarguesonis]NEI65592.1 tyrosine-type recombinase/integrase [Rhizobium leguminosarum]NEK52071.1 tyrosine-type recombinase/integrase [Rhizobium leguminosarum]
MATRDTKYRADHMTSQKRKLTKSHVDTLEPGPKPFRVYDAELKGFSVRVAPSGDKRWQVEYRPHPGGRDIPKKRMTLGATNVLTAEQAREQAKAILAEAAKGADPAAERLEKRREIKMSDLIDVYEKGGCYVLRGTRIGQPMGAKTKSYTIARLRNHAVPLIGTKRVSEVTSADIEQMVRDIAAGKTAKDEKIGPRRRIIVRGGDGAGRKVVRDVSALFTFAIRNGYRSDNPVENAAVNKVDQQRTHFLTLEKFQQLGLALDELEAEGIINRKAIDITRLWAMTGCRRDEIAALKWCEVDFEQCCLVLEKTKTGRSIRPLAAPALMLLSSLPRYSDSPFVFPASSGDGYYQGTKRVWPKIVKKAKLPGLTPHILRHSVGAAAVSSGETLQMAGYLLGHASHRSTAIYAHIAAHPGARAADRTIGGIAAALGGKQAAPVAPLPQRKAER